MRTDKSLELEATRKSFGDCWKCKWMKRERKVKNCRGKSNTDTNGTQKIIKDVTDSSLEIMKTQRFYASFKTEILLKLK